MKITEDKLKEIAYELYKIDWERDHISTEWKLATYRLYELEFLEYDFRETFDEWLFEQGYDGEIYACFDEFIVYEYQDYEYMKYLLGNSVFLKAYEEYQKGV